MAHSPNQNTPEPYTEMAFNIQIGESVPSGTSRTLDAGKPKSRRTSPTQYEFIMATGDESASSAKQKLKTVRSHVMKNYIQQQRQGQRPAKSSLSPDRRKKAKQQARLGRSVSTEDEGSPVVSEEGSLPNFGVGCLFAGASLADPFADSGADIFLPSAAQRPFALEFGFNAPRDWMSGAVQSYIMSLLFDKQGGLLEPSFKTLNFKGEVVKIIQETLDVCGSDVPQSIIFAVSLLASGCAVDCEWGQATGHLEALKRIVDLDGGLLKLDFELQRMLTWTAYCIAAALRLPPQFPPPIFRDVEPCPLALLDEAKIRAWRTVKRFPKDSGFAFDAVIRLHHLSLATSTEWYSHVDQRVLSNLYFDALYNVVNFQLEEPWNAGLPSATEGHDLRTMFRIWAAGLPLYVWATVRHVRARLGITVARSDFDPVLARIKDALEIEGGYHTWPRGKRLEPVLITLLYGIESCEYFHPWRIWATETVQKIVEMLKLKEFSDFRKALEFFPLTQEFHAAAEELWGDLMVSGSAAGTPSLRLTPVPSRS